MERERTNLRRMRVIALPCFQATRGFKEMRHTPYCSNRLRRSSASRCLQDFAQGASPQFHRNQGRDRQNITRHVGNSHTGISGRGQRRFKPFAHRLRIRHRPVIGIELPDRVEQREALGCHVFQRAQIFAGEKRKQKADTASSPRHAVSAGRRRREDRPPPGRRDSNSFASRWSDRNKAGSVRCSSWPRSL